MNIKKHDYNLLKYSAKISGLFVFTVLSIGPLNLKAVESKVVTNEKGTNMNDKTIAPNESVVSIADSKLKAALNAELGQVPDAAITRGQMRSLTSLSLSNKGIESIYGLGAAENLVSLDLSHNRIGEYSELSNLQKLETLNLSHNKIKSLQRTVNSPKLKNLDLSYNGISTFGATEYDLHGGSINLSNNQIAHVYDGTSVKNCISFDLSGNQINNFSDFAPLNESSKVNFDNQVIRLRDFQVTDNEPVYTSITNLQGEYIPLKLGTPKFGTFEYSLPVKTEIDSNKKTKITMTFNGKVTYEGFLNKDEAEISLGETLNDDEILSLFEVSGSYADGTKMNVNVDQSSVDYHKAGTYKINLSSATSQGLKIRKSVTLNIVDPNNGKTTTDESTDTSTKDNSTTTSTNTNTNKDNSSTKEGIDLSTSAKATAKSAKTPTIKQVANEKPTKAPNDKKQLANTGLNIPLLGITIASIGLVSLLIVRSKQK